MERRSKKTTWGYNMGLLTTTRESRPKEGRGKADLTVGWGLCSSSTLMEGVVAVLSFFAVVPVVVITWGVEVVGVVVVGAAKVSIKSYTL